MRVLCKLGVLVVLMALGREAAARQPFWVIDFEHAHPKRTYVEDPVKGPIYYWYMTYKVINRSEKARWIAMDAHLATDTGETYRDAPHPIVQKQIQKEDRRSYLNCVQVVGLLKPGTQKHGIAVFKSVDPKADRLTFTFGGLTGRKVVKSDRRTETYQRMIRVVEYSIPGDEYHIDESPLTLLVDKWVMTPKPEVLDLRGD